MTALLHVQIGFSAYDSHSGFADTRIAVHERVLLLSLEFVRILLLDLVVGHVVELATIEIAQQVTIIDLSVTAPEHAHIVLKLHRTHRLIHAVARVTQYGDRFLLNIIDADISHSLLFVDEVVQRLTKVNPTLVQGRIAAKNALHIEIRLAVSAQPNLSRLDVRVQQIENDVRFQHAVAMIRLQVLSHLTVNAAKHFYIV